MVIYFFAPINVMLGSWGFRFLVIVLLLASFVVISSGISYTGGIVSKQEFEPTNVYTCPEQECPENTEMEETIEGCRDVLKKYEKKVGELEKETEILRQRILMSLEGNCEFGANGKTMADVESVVDPEEVRDFAVFIVSNSGKDPVTSLYNYVRMNIMCVGDPGNEYLASPCETIILGGGDCEDHAILLASLLEAVGVDSKILWVPGEHAFVGISMEGIKIEGMCDDVFWLSEKVEDILVADTTFSNCIGKVSEEYFVFGENGWEWKEKPVVFDV